MHIPSLILGRSAKTVGLGVLCLLGSFAIGIQTAGEIDTVGSIEAGSIVEVGDVDGNGVVDLEDVRYILEVTQGYEQVSPHALQFDPTGDGRLTVDDALRLLQDLTL